MRLENVKLNHQKTDEVRFIANLVQVACDFKSSIYLKTEGKSINAKSIMGMMALSLENIDEISIQVEGSDEDKALDILVELFN